MGYHRLLLLFLIVVRFTPTLAYNIGPNFAANFIRSQLSMRHIKDLTVVEIKDELRARNERVSGSRAVLVKRLQNARIGKNLVQDEAEESEVDVEDTDEKEEEDNDEELKNSSFINDEKEVLEDSSDDNSVRHSPSLTYYQNISHTYQNISHTYSCSTVCFQSKKIPPKKKLRKTTPPTKHIVVWDNKKTYIFRDMDDAEQKAADTEGSMRIFKSRFDALTFKEEKKRAIQGSINVTPQATRRATNTVANNIQEPSSTESETTPTGDVRVGNNKLKEMFKKKMLDKAGNKIVANYIEIPGKNDVVVIVDFCRETRDADGTVIRKVSQQKMQDIEAPSYCSRSLTLVNALP